MGLRKRTNTFSLRCPDGAIGGRLKRNGDLDLLLNGHVFTTVPGNLIPALAHWLSGVNGRYSDIDPTKLVQSASILPMGIK